MPAGRTRRERRASLSPPQPKPPAAEVPPPAGFVQPRDVDGISAVMGAGREVFNLMPAMADIPSEFKSRSRDNPFIAIQKDWFYRGLGQGWPLKPKPGIDRGRALRHLGAVQKSFEPGSEHKEAAVAYLISLWFEEPTT